MYAGQLVEVAPVSEIFRSPRHPYTQALLAATADAAAGTGVAPRRSRAGCRTWPTRRAGCRFSTRCPYVMDVCATVPPLAHETDEHLIACWLSEATKQAGRPITPRPEVRREPGPLVERGRAGAAGSGRSCRSTRS